MICLMLPVPRRWQVLKGGESKSNKNNGYSNEIDTKIMSGPKTSHYRISAARRQEIARRQAEERKRREELAVRVAAAKERCADLEKRAGRLSHALGELRGKFPSERINVGVPDCSYPGGDDADKLEGFAERLENELKRAEASLVKAGEQAHANREFTAATKKAADMSGGEATTAAEAMRLFVESKASRPAGVSLTDRREEIDRILGRLGSENWRAASPRLESLVMEALSTGAESRFSALTTEIRLQVQEASERDRRRAEDAAKAKSILDRLDIEIPVGEDPLKQRLELVKAGAIAFSPEIESAAVSALSRASEAEQAALHASATEIVSDTLADLGYEVAPVGDTLFAKGGKVYFRKAGWQNYCVRLTVRPDESRMNFNVVRFDGESQATREADIEAENAWCSGYDKLVETLAARGLETQLTRHLPVGAVPVQTVGSDEVTASAFGTKARKSAKGQQANLVKGSDK